MKRTFTLILGIACLLLADDETPQKIEVAKTEHADLPSGGTVRFENSTGDLTIEGWDQPGVQISTLKSTKLAYTSGSREREKASRMLDKVKVSEARQGDELVITTEFPRHVRFLPHPSVGDRDFDLEYVVKVPRNAKLIVNHDEGEVHFDEVTGDVRATSIQGTILLHLPQTAQYNIDAKSHLGEVISDFPGTLKRRHWLSHDFTGKSPAPRRLDLRIGFGDIVILKIRTPPPPAPLIPAATPGGQ
jgi:hypothetical protein